MRLYKIIKRKFDIILSFFLLLIFSPFFIVIMFFLTQTAEGEVFYFQERVGKNLKNFHIWKFATMLKNSLNMGSGSITVRNDPRVTSIGRFLRITKINEFPQLINVLRGEMSFVGPRPLLKSTFNLYSSDIKETIMKNRPGITGIGSVFFRDEEKLISNFEGDKHEYYKFKIAPYKGALEKWYLNKISFLTDLKILILTLISLFFSSKKLILFFFKDIPTPPNFC